jgi:hypothetical protein
MPGVNARLTERAKGELLSAGTTSQPAKRQTRNKMGNAQIWAFEEVRCPETVSYTRCTLKHGACVYRLMRPNSDIVQAVKEKS